MSTFPRPMKRKVKRSSKKPMRRAIARKAPKREPSEVITYISKSLLPYPPRYRCKFTSEITGTIAAATAANRQYYVGMNYLYLPFNGGGWPAALPSITGLAPTGFSQMCNANYYDRYRVYGAKCEVAMHPQAAGDTILVAITPTALPGAPTSTAAALSIPMTKSKTFQLSQSVLPVTCFITQHKLLGCSKRAVEDDLSGQLIGVYNNVPAKQLYFQINTSTEDQAVLGGIMTYTCKVTWYVELFSNFNAQQLQT